jgi:hypothetical protein
VNAGGDVKLHPRTSRAALLTAAVASALIARAARGAEQQGGAAGEKKTQALEVLQEMSRALASAESVQFKVRALRPVQLQDGRWVTLVGGAAVAREGKDKLRVETSGDFYPFQLTFDGKTVTAFAPGDKVYAQQQAQGTIDDALARAEKRGEASFEFRDLISSNPYGSMTQGLVSALVVGTSTIEGVETQHVAVHASKLDWEIWIGKSDHLPRMVTLTDLAEARKPTQTVLFSDWKLGGKLPADTFTFNAPSDATRVPFRDPRQAAADARRESPASSGTASGGAQ